MRVERYPNWDALPEHLQKEVGHKSWNQGREYLAIYWNNGEIQLEISPGEPEDNRFCRDYSWIKPALERAARGE